MSYRVTIEFDDHSAYDVGRVAGAVGIAMDHEALEDLKVKRIDVELEEA